jgi:molybdate transport system permease protein
LFNAKIAFSWGATVLAAVVMSFPLMYRSARGALEQVDPNLIYAARTLGLSEWKIFWHIVIPAAKPGILGGGILAFARGMGEFGATTMIAGNIAGRTRTLPLAVYSAVASGDTKTAGEYVGIILILSLFIIISMNSFIKKERFIKRSGSK